MSKDRHIRVRNLTYGRLADASEELELSISELADRVLTDFLDNYEEEGGEDQEEDDAGGGEDDTCPSCGAPILEDPDECPECGEDLSEEE